MESPGGMDSFAREAEKLRVVFERNLPLYEALSNISNLANAFQKTSELQKAFESLPNYGKLHSDILKATDLSSALPDLEKFRFPGS